jgi:pleiotropic regulator 1
VQVREATSELTVEPADDSIKKWKCPEGTFVHNFVGHEAIINTLSLNEEGVLFSGGAYID